MQEGTIINYPCAPIEYRIDRIAICNGSDRQMIPCRVKPYWQRGLNFKVCLIPMIEGYGAETVYRSDLDSAIKKGNLKIRVL